MHRPVPSVLALLITLWLLVGWGVVVRHIGQRLGANLDAIELLALAFASICAIAAAANLVAYVIPIPLWLVALGLVAGPIPLVRVAVRRKPPPKGRKAKPESLEDRWKGTLRTAMPAIVIGLVAATLMSSFGVFSGFRTDEGWKTDAVKDLVWESSTAVALREDLSAEMPKYAGYLTARAVVTTASRELPSEPSFAWSFIAMSGLLAGVYALARGLGLGTVGAAASIIALPILGGDSYRAVNISDARGTAAAVLICGLFMFLKVEDARDKRKTGVIAGAICGLSALIHVQFILIAASVMLPLTALVWISRRSDRSLARMTLIPAVAAVLVMALAVPQASTFGTEDLQQTATERQPDETPPEENVLASGTTVWPPASAAVDGINVLYVSPRLHVMAPRQLWEGIWDERTSPLLSVMGLIAAVLLGWRKNRRAALLIGATIGVVVLVLFNPVAYPLFIRFFGIARTDYIGFEFSFLCVGAVIALVLKKPLWGIPLLLATLFVVAPVARESKAAYERKYEWADDMSAPEFTRWKRVADLTRYGDRIIVDARLLEASGLLCCNHRNLAEPPGMGLPSPYEPVEDPLDLAARIEGLDEQENLVFLVDDEVPEEAGVWTLIDDGALKPLPVSGSIEEGAYYLKV